MCIGSPLILNEPDMKGAMTTAPGPLSSGNCPNIGGPLQTPGCAPTSPHDPSAAVALVSQSASLVHGLPFFPALQVDELRPQTPSPEPVVVSQSALARHAAPRRS